MNLEIELLKEMMIWDIKNNKPYDVFIKGTNTTRLNLEWFTYENNEYHITTKGSNNIINYILKNK